MPDPTTDGVSPAAGCDSCREIGPLATAPGTSGRDWLCEACGTVWPGAGPVSPAVSDEMVRVVADLMGWPMTTGTGFGVGGDPESYAAGLRASVDAVLAELRPLIEAEAEKRGEDRIVAMLRREAAQYRPGDQRRIMLEHLITDVGRGVDLTLSRPIRGDEAAEMVRLRDHNNELAGLVAALTKEDETAEAEARADERRRIAANVDRLIRECYDSPAQSEARSALEDAVTSIETGVWGWES